MTKKNYLDTLKSVLGCSISHYSYVGKLDIDKLKRYQVI